MYYEVFQCGILGCESIFEQTLNEHVLVVEEKHDEGCGTSPLFSECCSMARKISMGV